TMPNTRSGASRTRKGINKQVDCQMAGALGAHNAARNLEPLMRDRGGQEEVNGNGGNGNGNEATAKVYAIGGGGANPNSNVVTGTFLLNNCYALMLFDSGADRSFMSSTFSALLDVS
ncbi:hypothetical protein Tco_0436882, partial [Tanacetum coccineum]